MIVKNIKWVTLNGENPLPAKLDLPQFKDLDELDELDRYLLDTYRHIVLGYDIERVCDSRMSV